MRLLKRKAFASVFARVYLGIVFGLVSTLLAFFFLGEQYLRSTEAERFLQDAQFFMQKYVSYDEKTSDSQESLIYKELKQTGKARFFIFDFALIPTWKGEPPCPECDFIRLVGDVPVYQKENGLNVAVFNIRGTEDAFVFSENRDFFVPEVEWHQDSEVIFVITLVISIFLILALCIYFPTKRLDKYLKALITLGTRFGRGETHLRANENVPSPISSLAITFNQVANDVEDKIKQSQIFAQAISHEVRTPLSRIQLTSDMARRYSPNEYKYLYDEIDTYIDDINALTRNIVTVAKLATSEGENQYQYQSIGVVSLCRDRVRFCSPKKGIFSNGLGKDKQILIEPTLARLLLDNILKNADKYTENKVWVTVNADKANDKVEIIVDDDGPGIPKDKVREVFLAFSRLDKSRSSDSGGFGLGLTIAMSAAKILGWRIYVSDSPKGGARFIVSIPATV